MSDLKVVEFTGGRIDDIPKTLRTLAENIEKGEFGDVHNLVWVIDEGDGVISVGLMGSSASPGAEAHLLMSVAQRKLENNL